MMIYCAGELAEVELRITTEGSRWTLVPYCCGCGARLRGWASV